MRIHTWVGRWLIAAVVFCPFAVEARTHDVMEYGAVADAKTDNTAAFQKALDAANAAGGGIVSVPTGAYRFEGHLTIPDSVTLEGVWRTPPMIHYRYSESFKDVYVGTMLLATEGAGDPKGTPFITLMHNATLKGIAIYYPDQTKTNPPVAYPWTVASGGADNCTLLDVLLVNPYQGVDFGTRVAGRHMIRNLYGQPLYRGLFIDNCLDVGRVENVHFWPFWSGDPAIRTFMETQGEAFNIGRTDWQFFSNCFCIWYNVGFRFGDFGHGPGNVLLTQCGSDIGPYAVVVDKAQSHSGVSFVNGQIYGALIVNEDNTGPVKFTACGFFGSTDGNSGVSQGRLNGYGQVSFQNCHFIAIDPNNNQNRVMEVNGGGVSFNGCEFLDSGKEHIYLGKDVQSAIIVGNRFRGTLNVTNEAEGSVQIGLNTDDTRKEEPNAIILDDSDVDGKVTMDAGWNRGFTGRDYLGAMHWTAAGKGERKVVWTPDLPEAGSYAVFVWYGADNNSDRATNAPYTVQYQGGSKVFRVSMKEKTGRWYKLGVFPFEKGKKGSVELSNDADGYLAADAVKFLRQED